MMSVRPSPRAAVCVSLQPELGAGNRVETVDVLPTTGVVWCGAARAVHVRWLHRRIEGHGRATPKANLYFSHGNPTSMHGDPASTHGNPVSVGANLTCRPVS